VTSLPSHPWRVTRDSFKVFSPVCVLPAFSVADHAEGWRRRAGGDPAGPVESAGARAACGRPLASVGER